MEVISPRELSEASQRDAMAQWIDVRSTTEFGAGHIPGAINIPLEEIEPRLDDISANLPIILICKGGVRARMAAGFLTPCRPNIMVLEGGTDAWAEAGLPVVVSKKTRWSLERQVRLAAGVIVLTASIAAALHSSSWLLLSGFVGAGLTFAGLSDICPMGTLLAVMPWNRARKCESGNRQRSKCCV